MNKLIDFILCSGITALEVIGIILLALLIQCICYRLFNLNIYQNLVKIIKED